MSGAGEITRAPWKPEEVVSLNEYQLSGAMHPFTCGYCRDRLGTRFVREDDGTLHTETTEEWEALRDAFDEGRASELVERVVIDDHLLVATETGWTCPTCDYRQDWAWAWMADRSWEQVLRPSDA